MSGEECDPWSDMIVSQGGTERTGFCSEASANLELQKLGGSKEHSDAP